MKFSSVDFVLVVAIMTVTAVAGKQTFLTKTCSSAQDCYLLPGVLELACYYSVGLCNCQLTINSIHRVESVNGACLMSKYGPCGSNGTESGLVVGCLDGFECIKNQCRDPTTATAGTGTGIVAPIKYESPFVFHRPCSSVTGAGDCEFNDSLRFTCNYELGRCQCEDVEIADAASAVWDLRNYDGVHNCSVGKFGPCGSKNGIEVTCHGAAVKCLQGRCVDPSHPVAGPNESCELGSDCELGLICSAASGWSCIKPKSIGKGAACGGDEECQPGLRCKSFGWTSSCV